MMMEKDDKRSGTMENNYVDSSIENNIKKDNKKAGKLFIVMMIVCGIAGGIIGMLSMMAVKNISEVSQAFERFMRGNMITFSIAIPLFMIFTVLFIVVQSSHNIKITKRDVSRYIETDDDEALNKIDKKLSYNLWVINEVCILQYFLFSVMMFADFKFGPQQIPKISIYTVVVFLAAILIIIKVQQKLVDCVRIINPEKKGSIYDLNFSKKWEDSCDEAEKITIYKAAYKAYQRVNLVCIILWAVFVCLGIVSGIGFLPTVAVIIIWTVLTFTYNYYAVKYKE